jgi:hypothetical protein
MKVHLVIPENIHTSPTEEIGINLTPRPSSDILTYYYFGHPNILLSEIFLILPLHMAEISSVGAVWIFSGTQAIAMHLN